MLMNMFVSHHSRPMNDDNNHSPYHCLGYGPKRVYRISRCGPPIQADALYLTNQYNKSSPAFGSTSAIGKAFSGILIRIDPVLLMGTSWRMLCGVLDTDSHPASSHSSSRNTVSFMWGLVRLFGVTVLPYADTASGPTTAYGPSSGITFDRFVRACVAVKTLTEAFQRYLFTLSLARG
jgi:hypothetical protein